MEDLLHPSRADIINFMAAHYPGVKTSVRETDLAMESFEVVLSTPTSPAYALELTRDSDWRSLIGQAVRLLEDD